MVISRVTVAAAVVMSLIVTKVKVHAVSNQSEKALYLSPYIRARDIATAQALSRVTDDCNPDFRSDCDVSIPESYAGYLTVDEKMGKHIFFWFFPSQTEATAPVAIWLNGGPGVSSTLGLFWENGPLQPRPRDRLARPAQATTDDDFVPGEFEARERSWVGPFSMLYIDNPVGTGYSYAERENPLDIFTQESYAEDLYQFVEQFYMLFPDSMRKELYIGGQSYAGKYVPALAYRIHQAINHRESKLPLAGIYMGGPFYAPEIMLPSAVELFYSLGTISWRLHHQMRADNRQYLRDCYSGRIDRKQEDLDRVMGKVFGQIELESRDNYVTGEIPPYFAVQRIMASQRVRQAVHVGSRPYNHLMTQFDWKFNLDFLSSARSKIAALLDSGRYKVLVFNGNFDAIVSTRMVEEAVLQTHWVGGDEYRNASRELWYGPITEASLAAGTEKTQQLYGFYTRVGELCRVVVHGAGHQVPHDQPDIARVMMQQFVKAGCVA